ncbi:succinylglutamate desuccinylase/aspartoacylase family protein [Natrononativus amylolyticus]|uniref:succinylglutamate desuccinylase/aspartoacylase family protein n=1 Tax=Natrononativus amylolyticus TaxID=2963434 RepID=UPI0020CC25E4|nr:succinylglutamate desuccinylase/aspartoacylase family protein [Natrononativus amylolyticus]
MRRRRVLAAGGVFAGTAIAGAWGRPSGGSEALEAARAPAAVGDVTTNTETLLPDTVHETPLYEIDAAEDGPTVMVFGGVHGDEYNGIVVAHEAASWQPDAGTLVVIPETDVVAVKNDRRGGVDGDLNRHFPPGGEPESELARGIWAAVERHDPDVVIDLHRSLGIYGVHQQYVGQAIFHSPDAYGEDLAVALNDAAIPWYMPFHDFTASTSTMNGPLLFHEAYRELEATAYLFETTDFLLDQETMNEWTRLAVAKLLEFHGLLESGEPR